MSVARKHHTKSHHAHPMVRRVSPVRVRPPSLWEAFTVWWAWLDGYSLWAALFRRPFTLPRGTLIKCVPTHRGKRDRFFLFFGQRPVNGIIVHQIPKNLKVQTYPPESPFLPKMPPPREMARIYFSKAMVTHYLASLIGVELLLWAGFNFFVAPMSGHAFWGLRLFYFWSLIYPFIHYRIFSPKLEYVFFRKLLHVEGTLIQIFCLLDYFTR